MPRARSENAGPADVYEASGEVAMTSEGRVNALRKLDDEHERVRSKLWITERLSFEFQRQRELRTLGVDIVRQLCDAKRALITQEIDHFVNEIRAAFFVERKGQTAEMYEAILEISERAKAAVAERIGDADTSIIRRRKKELDDAKRDLDAGEILQDDYERKVQRINQLTERMLDSLDETTGVIFDSFARDIRTALSNTRVG